MAQSAVERFLRIEIPKFGVGCLDQVVDWEHRRAAISLAGIEAITKVVGSEWLVSAVAQTSAEAFAEIDREQRRICELPYSVMIGACPVLNGLPSERCLFRNQNER